MGADAVIAISGKLRTYLQLGRISNLPTVWTNVLTGMVLTGGPVTLPHVVGLTVALSLFYIGGMFLNDAFDREHDRVIRPDRPIPAGMAAPREVLMIGFGLLAGGLLVLGYFAAQGGRQLLAAGILLALLIVFYDLHHKQNPWSPLVMGLCRAMVYVISGLSVGSALPTPVVVGAVLQLSYVAGLSVVARHEGRQRSIPVWAFMFLLMPFAWTLPAAGQSFGAGVSYTFWLGWVITAIALARRQDRPGRRQAVGHLVAGISLLDVQLIAGTGDVGLTCWALLGFLMTVMLQKSIPGV